MGASLASSIQYSTIGTAPNRQFVVQWADCDHYNTSAAVNHWNFQIILNETTNTIQVVWGTSTDVGTFGANNCAATFLESGDVGLLGSLNTDFNLRSVTNGTNTWATSAAGLSLTNVCNMSPTNIPVAGLTYTWTPGPVLPMVYNSSNTLFMTNGTGVSRGVNTQVLQVQVNVTNTGTPFNISSLALSTTGSTNAGTDIADTKVYFTGSNNTFSTATLYGTAVAPSGAYIVSGSANLTEGINYFWITYDVSATANFGDNLSGCCMQINGSGTMGTQVPTVTCPAGTQTVTSAGSWTPVANLSPTGSGGLMLLLSDGTVMAKSNTGGGSYGNGWNKLTPNNGSYINGTWSAQTPMVSTRLYFSSQVLKDGRVYVAGGEYGTGLATGEVYDPVANSWTSTPAPGSNVSDANSEILPDGRVLQALVTGSLTGTKIYNPVTNTYIAGPTALGIHNESAWVKLRDSSILYINRLSTASERYIPSTNTWINDAVVPVSIYDPFGDEAGGAMLLPDGRAFFLGSSGHTAYYTPSGTTAVGAWAAGPDIPGSRGTPDAAAAMMVDGRIICTVSQVPTSANHFPSPTYYYEFNYLTNIFTLIPAPAGGSSSNNPSFISNFLCLPNGTVLFNNQGSIQYYVYTPAGAPLAAGKPTISTITPTSCTTYRITGTLFNGITEGATYGDDWQMATNYPIVKMVNGANVYYARTFNWNSTNVQRGAALDTAQFTLPAGLPLGSYQVSVSANGNSSNPRTMTIIAQPNNWTGDADNTWENLGNWSCGVLPDANTDVLIPSGTCIVSSAAICRSLTVMPGVIFTVTAGFGITIAH